MCPFNGLISDIVPDKIAELVVLTSVKNYSRVI